MKTNSNYTSSSPVKWITLLLFCMLLFSMNALFAQSSVIGLRFNGQNVNSANTTVMPPGNGGSKSQINVGDQLQSGTRLIIPPNTIVVLQSPGGKQVCSSTTGKTMEYTVSITSNGENHTVRGSGAQVSSTVKKAVGYNYRVNNGRGTTSAARGTEFTFTDMSHGDNEKASITTQEGSINIIDQVPVHIGGQSAPTNKRGEPVTKAVSRTQSQGDAQYTSSNIPVNYDDYSQAIQFISDEINAIEDPEERADNLLCLGDLYMDFEQPQNAINPYHQAYQIFNDYYGEEDLYTLEAVISLSEALAHSGDVDNANQWIGNAYNILQELAAYNVEDLQYLSELEYVDEYDQEAYAVICEELSEIYGLLGWAYEITGDTVTSDQYYGAMENPCD